MEARGGLGLGSRPIYWVGCIGGIERISQATPEEGGCYMNLEKKGYACEFAGGGVNATLTKKNKTQEA